MIYIFTGNGKGKTSAAIGTAIRALGNNKKVLFIQFMKDKTLSSESKILENLENITVKSFGRKGFYLPKRMLDKDPELKSHGVKPLEDIDKNLVMEGFKFILGNKDKYDLVILDELCVVIFFKLVKKSDVLNLIKNLKDKDIIITGRNCPKYLINLADLVTDMVEIKHPYQKGIKAKKGLDF